MWFSAATLLSVLPLLVSAAPVAENKPKVDYDAIVVGGGPAGLAALSGLARVRRNVLLVDSGVYRNGPTRHMHDVLGFDGTTIPIPNCNFMWLHRTKLLICMCNRCSACLLPIRGSQATRQLWYCHHDERNHHQN